MNVTLIMANGTWKEIDLDGTLCLFGEFQDIITASDTEPPDVIVEEPQADGSLPRVFVRKNKPLPGIRAARPLGPPIFREVRYGTIPPIR